MPPGVKKVGFLYDDVYLEHEMPTGHPECRERLVAIIDKLRGSDVWDRLVHVSPRRAEFPQLEKVHTRGHIEHIRKTRRGYADPDTFISEGSLDAALYAAGAVMEAVDRCRAGEIERAFCAVRPPGHHAEADRAMGFCLFNNVAVGARYAQEAGYPRVFIVDFDVHHGNGTQHIFDHDDTVFYFSTHQSPHYPGTGATAETGSGKGKGYTANFPVHAGAGDREYLVLYKDILPGLMEKFSPDIVLVSSGYDIRSEDPLANIRVSGEGIENIVEGVLSCSSVPAVFSLEGGYDLNALADSVYRTIKVLLNKD